MASGYWKLALRGTYEGQAITNILYYGAGGGSGPLPGFDASQGADLIDTFGESVVEHYVNALPPTYLLERMVATFVDPRGVVDPTGYAIELGMAVPGDGPASTDGQAVVAIVAFQTEVALGAALPMKRSYIAYGPLASGYVGDNSKLQPSFMTATDALVALLDDDLVGTEGTYGPYRVGRTEAPDPIRVGRVLGVARRNNASFRKSRKPRPSAA